MEVNCQERDNELSEKIRRFWNLNEIFLFSEKSLPFEKKFENGINFDSYRYSLKLSVKKYIFQLPDKYKFSVKCSYHLWKKIAKDEIILNLS